jgi:hypothetical protein
VEATNTAEAKIPANQDLTDIAKFSEFTLEISLGHREGTRRWYETPEPALCIAFPATYFNVPTYFLQVIPLPSLYGSFP